MDDLDLQRQHYNKISSYYLKSRSSSRHQAYKELLWRHILKEMERHLGRNSDLHGLDAMCGDADSSLRMIRHFNNVTMSAFDYSEEMVAAAREATGGTINVFKLDITKLADREKYDFVVLIGGLHHVPGHTETALRNIHYSLRRNGIFLNFEPTHNNFLWERVRDRIYEKNALFEENTEQDFKLRDYNDLLERTGFRIKHQVYPGLAGYVLYYNPDAFPWLDKGPNALARILCNMDLMLGRTFVGRFLSFATLTIAGRD